MRDKELDYKLNANRDWLRSQLTLLKNNGILVSPGENAGYCVDKTSKVAYRILGHESAAIETAFKDLGWKVKADKPDEYTLDGADELFDFLLNLNDEEDLHE